jgi:DNA-binding NtrC family response regulator
MVSFSGTQQVGGKQAKVRGTIVLAPDFKSNVQRIEASVLNPAPRLGGSSADAARSETADAADDEFGVFRSPAMIAMLETVKRIAALSYAMRATNGRMDLAARRLGLSRKGLYLKRQRLGLQGESQD